MTLPIRFRPEAQDEFDDGADWYEQQPAYFVRGSIAFGVMPGRAKYNTDDTHKKRDRRRRLRDRFELCPFSYPCHPCSAWLNCLLFLPQCHPQSPADFCADDLSGLDAEHHVGGAQQVADDEERVVANVDHLGVFAAPTADELLALGSDPFRNYRRGCFRG